MARLALGLVLIAACSRGATTSSEPQPVAACDELAERVRALYQDAPRVGAPPPSDELEAELLDANVAMVLADCLKAPERVAACIKSAPDPVALERDCLIPLDDEGAIDGQALAAVRAQ